MARLEHSGIVRLVDLLKDDKFYYIFLELCADGDLCDYIIQHKKLRESEAKVFLKQNLEALDCIHRNNVAHRDLKPDNVFTNSKSSKQIKIGDFGLVKISEPKALTSTMCGFQAYVSPEFLSGQSYGPLKGDIWTCGVILYMMVIGTIPWTKTGQQEMYKQIREGDYTTPSFLTDQYRNLIEKFMCVNPEERITIREALHHPWLIDTQLPLVNQSAFVRSQVTQHDIDLFFGIQPNDETQQMDLVPILPEVLTQMPNKRCSITERKPKVGLRSLVDRRNVCRPKIKSTFGKATKVFQRSLHQF